MRFIIIIFLLLNLNWACLAQLPEEKLKEKCINRFYDEYVKIYELPNFGGDSSKLSWKYNVEEIFQGIFKNYSFYRIAIQIPHTSHHTYCINKINGNLISGDYFIEQQDVIQDATIEISDIEKCFYAFVIENGRSFNYIIQSENERKGKSILIKDEHFEYYMVTTNKDGKPFKKKYSFKVSSGKVVFWVYAINILTTQDEIIEYQYQLKDGKLIGLNKKLHD